MSRLLAGTLALALLLLAAPPDSRAAGPRAELRAVPAATDVLLVQPRDGLALEALERGLEALGHANAAGAPLANAVRVAVPPGADPAAVASAIAGSGLAGAVEPDDRVHAARVVEAVPDDALYARQASYLEAVRAPQAWAHGGGSDDVVIAVIDSGLDFNHPDLQARVFVNEGEREGFLNERDDDGNGCVDDLVGCSFVSPSTADPSCGHYAEPPHWQVHDDEGHGTFVAGVAAAAGDNALGVTGVAWDARVLPVKVLDCTATGRISDAAAGIRYAAEMGADVINVSFGSPNDSLVLRSAVEAAQASGALIVASAGNDGRGEVTYPAAYPGVIAVSAGGLVTSGGVDYHSTALFSNFGGEVDVLAPGLRVLSTVPPALCGQRGWRCEDGEPYAVASGTSFATPMVAGAAALLRARHPDAGPDLQRALLLGSLAPRAVFADAGLLDIGAALERPLYGAGAPGMSRDTAIAEGGPPGPAGN